MKKFSRIIEYKVNLQKSVVFNILTCSLKMKLKKQFHVKKLKGT